MCPKCEGKISMKKMFVFVGLFMLGIWGLDSYAQSHHHNMEPNSQGKFERKNLPNKTKKEILAVLEVNEKLHRSFFDYNVESVAATAKELKGKMDKVSDPELAKLLEFSKTKLADMKASNEREINNQNYHLVSMALIHIINKYDVGERYNSYSCPMAKKRWVQNASKMAKVNNPYMAGMPHCGTQNTHF